MSSNVSFTIRRPSPVSRAASSGPDSDVGSSFKIPLLPSRIPLNDDSTLGSPLTRSATSSPRPSRLAQSHVQHQDDSSDEDSVIEDELVTGFDKFGVQRCVFFPFPPLQLFQLTKVIPAITNSLNGEKKEKKTLVIPPLKNKDWRELARKRRNGNQYVFPSAPVTGKDGSVGGLGTKDTINSGPVLSGLQVRQKAIPVVKGVNIVEDAQDVKMEIEEETEDQKALRAILAETNGETHDGLIIDIIPNPISEADALKQDVDELPDAATLDDYARVPVSQFGAALLRGMGWKEGTAASRKPGKGLIEPYLPSARPSLLGIGAKEQELYDDGSKKSGKSKRPDRRYVPVIKQERSDTPSNGTRNRSRSPRGPSTAISSRHGSRSPSRYNGRSERRGDSRRRESTYDTEGRDRDRERRRGDVRHGRHDDERDRSDRKRDRSRESSRRK